MIKNRRSKISPHIVRPLQLGLSTDTEVINNKSVNHFYLCYYQSVAVELLFHRSYQTV